MKIYTKTGDSGKTSLFTGKRVSKADVRVEAYGLVDELNAWLGLLSCTLTDSDIREIIYVLQNELFDLGADLATPSGKTKNKRQKEVPRINAQQVKQIEDWIDHYQDLLPPLHNFILPGGSIISTYIQITRGVCRRAEREVVRLSETESVNPEILKYLNRLSDLLFVLARVVNQRQNITEPIWKPRK